MIYQLDELDPSQEAVKKQRPREQLVFTIGEDLGHGKGLPLTAGTFAFFTLVYLYCKVNKCLVFFP